MFVLPELKSTNEVRCSTEEIMANEKFGTDAGIGNGSSDARRGTKATTGAGSSISEIAQQATEKAKDSVSTAATTATNHVKDLLDQQVTSGAEIVGHLASSAKRAASDLDRDAPQIAGIVRDVANKMEGFAKDMQAQSVDQLWRAASDFTRRRPAVVFGAASLAGFFVYRALKNATSDDNQHRVSGMSDA